MRIVLVNKFLYPKGGADRHCLDLARLLINQGHEVSLFGMTDLKNGCWADDDLFVSPVDFEKPRGLVGKLKVIGRMFYSLEARRKFGQLLDRRQPDIIHVHNIYHQLSPSILSEAKKRHIPVVMTLHDFKLLAPNYLLYHDGAVCERTKPNHFFQAVIHKCIKGSTAASLLCALESWLHRKFGLYTNNVDCFISPSKFLAGKVREYGIPVKRLEVVPNFLPTKPTPEIEDRGYALFFGRLSEEKGADVLIKAWRELPDAPLTIAGTGPLEKSLKQQAGDLPNITFTGYQTGADLNRLIAGARVIVVPSIWYENQPLTILEAFQFGKPVIASNIGAIPKLVEPANGLLFKPGDPKDLARAVRELWTDQNRLEKISRVNKAKADDYTPERYLEKITKLYQELLQ